MRFGDLAGASGLLRMHARPTCSSPPACISRMHAGAQVLDVGGVPVLRIPVLGSKRDRTGLLRALGPALRFIAQHASAPPPAASSQSASQPSPQRDGGEDGTAARGVGHGEGGGAWTGGPAGSVGQRELSAGAAAAAGPEPRGGQVLVVDDDGALPRWAPWPLRCVLRASRFCEHASHLLFDPACASVSAGVAVVQRYRGVLFSRLEGRRALVWPGVYSPGVYSRLRACNQARDLCV